MRSGFAGLAAAAVLAAMSSGVWAQGTQVPFGALKQDPSAPVEVVADQLAVDQTDGSAIFTGNVTITQGEMKLTAQRVHVLYAQTGEGQQKVDRLEASGGVTLIAGAEAAESREAIYTVDSAQVVMTGDVLVTQGPNTLSSQKMTVDLKSGTGIMEGGVKTLLQTGTRP